MKLDMDSIEFSDTLAVMAFALMTTCIAECTLNNKINMFIQYLVALWIMIYRKDEYKTLKKNIESTTNKLTKQKD